MAFRNVPMNPDSWKFLALMAEHPESGKTYYFVDKCLPFGNLISCTILKFFLDETAILVTHRTHKPVIKYLDDYFFAAINKLLCDMQVGACLQLCSEVKFSVSLEKTDLFQSLV